MKQFFLLLLSATTFAVAQEDLSVSLSILIHKTNSESGVLLINSSRNSSLQQISNNQGRSFRFLLLMDTKLFFDGTAVFTGQNQVY
jgi:hypothetical protein